MVLVDWMTAMVLHQSFMTVKIFVYIDQLPC